jgi:hypothetical protein
VLHGLSSEADWPGRQDATLGPGFGGKARVRASGAPERWWGQARRSKSRTPCRRANAIGLEAITLRRVPGFVRIFF